MIGKVTRGTSAPDTMRYLFGPGHRERHRDPHIIAGFRPPAWLEPPSRPDGSRDLRRLNGLFTQTVAALFHPSAARPVWRCSLRACPEDRRLSDEEWAAIATDVMDRTGLARHGDDEAVRWIAVRHSEDHIHIVATLARQDGRTSRLWNDALRVRSACRAAEVRYGLRATAAPDRTAAPWPTRGEIELPGQRGFVKTPRFLLRELVHAAAVAASGEREFFARLGDAGILIRKRREPTGAIVGYAVALPEHIHRDGTPYYFGGGTLAPDLSLPKLRHRWLHCGPCAPMTDDDRRTLWMRAPGEIEAAAGEARRLTLPAPAAASDIAWATTDLLMAAACAYPEDAMLRHAGHFYDQAAREPQGLLPSPTPTGHRLRTLARNLMHAADEPARYGIRPLVHALAELTTAAADLRDAQGRASQATAARIAVRYLSAAGNARPPARGRARGLRAFLEPEPKPFKAGRAADHDLPQSRSRPREGEPPSRPARTPGQPRHTPRKA